MTEKAYAMGFCKTAESVGVDPELLSGLLVKSAYDDDSSVRNTLGELLGTFGGSSAGGAGIGATLGALLAKATSKGNTLDMLKKTLKGGKIGLRIGAVGPLVGGVAALATPGRSRRKQRRHDDEGRFLEGSFVPGVGTYNLVKRLGAAIRELSGR